MTKLQWHIKTIVRDNRDRSPATQTLRSRALALMAKQLRQDLGYRHLESVHELRGRHVEALVRLWFDQGLNPGTIKNKLSYLRWLLRKVNRQSVMKPRNDDYLVPRRAYVATKATDKAQELDMDKLTRIENPYVAWSLKLMAAFGLRRKEAIKFKVAYAYQPGASEIRLKGSWTKGGRERRIPIETPAQRALLEEVASFAGKGSLIPAELTYIEQVRRFDHWVKKVGLHHMHGLRHEYAQRQYEALSGLTAPVKLGDLPEWTDDERERDLQARKALSPRLGHGRTDVMGAYIGTRRSRKKKPPEPSE